MLGIEQLIVYDHLKFLHTITGVIGVMFGQLVQVGQVDYQRTVFPWATACFRIVCPMLLLCMKLTIIKLQNKFEYGQNPATFGGVIPLFST